MDNTNEAVVSGTIAGATKVAATLAKAGAKAAAGAAKGAAKGSKAAGKAAAKGAKAAAKGAKKATSTADRMAAAYTRNKNLIAKKQGLPSNKMANSGKKTVDPTKNTTTKQAKKPSTGLPDNSPSRDIGKDVDQSSADRRKEKIDQKVGDAVNNARQRAKDAIEVGKKTVKKAAEMPKKIGSAVSGGFGTSSFKKESISFQEFIDRIPDIEEDYADE